MIGDGSRFEDQDEYCKFMAMKFSSEDEGFAFYNQYAKEKGFSVRKDYSRRDRFSGLIFHRRFTCSREGFRKEVYMDYSGRTREPRALTHCGCNAHFEIKLDEIKGHWYVTRFVADHNHPLCKADEVAFLCSHRRITPAQQAKLVELRDLGLHQHQVMDVIERDHGGFEGAGFVTRDLYNFFVKMKKKRIDGGDADRVIKYMQARQKDDMDFYYEYETDEAGCLKRLFWADPQSRIDYDAFGDVVVFDSTYRVNKYNLPFIPFVGVNHHGSTVIFGCAVVSDERVGTYEWVLKQFLSCMCQKHPKSVITGGDNAMRRAILLVFPNSDHRLCTWHIEQNMARNLSPTMLSDFRVLVNAPLEEDEFERKWVEFKVKHKVSDENRWLNRMYNLRKKWAAAYTKGRVFLGMKSNQRSESLNSKLHRLLDRKMSLVILIEHYEHCLSRMRHQEAELDAKASQSVPFTSNDSTLIEKDAAHVFTPKIFKKVKVELYMGMNWEVIDTIEEDNCVRYVLQMIGKDGVVILTGMFEEALLVSICCPCRKMECEYIPCNHLFAVLNYLKLDTIPTFCIARRWTMKAKNAFPSDRYGSIYTWSDQMERYRLLRCLGSEAFFKSSMTEESTVKVMKMLENLMLEEDSSENYENFDIEFGYVVGQSSRNDIESGDMVLDPTQLSLKELRQRE